MSEPLLAVRDLHAWYGEGHALHGVDLDVRRGETVTLLGRNGVGKTTTLRAIMGLIRKRTGSVIFNGKDLIRLPLHRVAHQGIGFVPEERGIFATLTVDENLMLPPVLRPGGLSVDEIYTLFPNLLQRRHSPGTRLSGGEQQMLAIARILRTGARLLLLDEPTEGLAPVIVERIGQTIGMLRERGFTVLMVEQNFRFASTLADRFYVIEEGQVAAHFRRDELDAQRSRIESLLGL